MVLRGVIILSVLWIGTSHAMPNEFHRSPRNVALAGDSNEIRESTVDRTARMDLIKSIDDIISSPYDGPYLESLDPLMHRNSFRRPQRDSANFRRNPSESSRFSFRDEEERDDRFPQATIGSEFPSSFSEDSFLGKPSFNEEHRESSPFGHSEFTESRPDRRRRRPNREREENPFKGSFSTFNFDSPEEFDHHNREREQERERDDTFVPPNRRRRRPQERHQRRPQERPVHQRPVEHRERRPFHSDPFRSSFSRPEFRRTRNRRDTSSLNGLLRDNDEDNQYERADNSGFISGRPNSFPDFASIGGFGSLTEGAEIAGNFNSHFEFPSVAIHDVNDQQPQFRSQNFGNNQIVDIEHDTLFRKDTNKIQLPKNNRQKRSSPVRDLMMSPAAHPPALHHRTVARKEANPESYVPHARVPRRPPHYPFNDNGHRAESISYYSREEDIYGGPRRQFNPHNIERERGEQRFFPSFPQGRLYAPGPRGGHGSSNSFSRRRPSFRSQRTHEAFASHRFNDLGPLDSSLLGSGNFEVIRGGTYYDNDDPHLNHNPYDPYLDNSYVVFPHGGNSHNHNHVDDFFSNFRDFSEFATRRSGTDHYDEGGYASEHIPSISFDLMTSESNQNATVEDKLQLNKTKKIQSKIRNDDIDERKLKPKQLKKNTFIKTKKLKSKNVRPKNIQEVLELVDPFPKLQISNLEELDPLIATY